MNSYAKLMLEAAFVVFITVCLFERTRKIGRDKSIHSVGWQIKIGIIYGIIAIGATEFGAPIDGAIMNIRDAAPLCAGLYFGAPAGIIAGVIGAIERWLCVYWGGGEFTRLACTLGTLFAGCFGALIKKVVLEKRCPGWMYAFIIGGVAEVFHLLMVFLTNTNEVALSMHVMYTCAPIMVPLVASICALTSFIIQLIDCEAVWKRHGHRKIVQDIQAWLMISVIVTFVLTNGFEYITQTHLTMATADNAILQTLADVENDAKTSGLEGEELGEFLKNDVVNWHIGTTGFLNVFDLSGNLVGHTTDNSIIELTGEREQLGILRQSSNLTTTYVETGGFGRYQAYLRIGDYYVVGYYPAAEANLAKDFSVLITAFLEVVILAVLFLQIYWLISKIVVKNLKKITSDLARISSGNLDTVVNVRSNEEFVSLSDDINTTVSTLKHYIKEASERIDAELQFAKDIQYSALPTVYPENEAIDLYANMLAAKHVGGDFYDFYPVGEDRIAIMVADVSGKGIPAALFMMKAKTLLKGLVEEGHGPAEAFTMANNELCNGNTAEMFVTAWLGILDIKTKVLTYVNAGHNAPIIGDCNNGTGEYLKGRHGFVLAGMEGIKYKEETLQMEAGQIVFLYTDGVTEATDANNELYGDDRLLKTFVETNAVNMRYFIKALKGDVDKFVGDAPQFDDITMLGLKLRSEIEIVDEIDLSPKKDSLTELEGFVENFCENRNLSIKTNRRIMVIVDEVYSNIVNYSEATICNLKFVYRKGLIAMTFKDDGKYYDPLQKEDPDTTLTAEDRDIGGLGIFMVKEMSEDVKYGRINGNNVLDVVIKE